MTVTDRIVVTNDGSRHIVFLAFSRHDKPLRDSGAILTADLEILRLYKYSYLRMR